MYLPNRILPLLLLLGGLILCGRVARAAEDLCLADPACAQLDKRAEQRFNSGDVAGALAASQEAFAIQPEPRLVLNIGRYYHALGRYTEALGAYQRYDRLAPAPDPEMRQLRDRFVREAEEEQRKQAEQASKAKKPVYKKAWFWATLGAIVVTGITAGLVGGLAGREKFSETREY